MMMTTCAPVLKTRQQPALKGLGASAPLKRTTRAVRSVRVRAEAPSTSSEKSTGFGELMAFGGVAPELINGRLAMGAFAAAVGAELATGETVSQQFSEAPLAVAAFMGVITLATFAPKLRGDDMNPANGWESLKKSPFTSPATIEMWNGRAAMLGLVGLLVL